MGIKKAGGYVFKTRTADHGPYHVHILDGQNRFLGRWDIEHQRPIGALHVTKSLLRALYEVGYLREKP